MNMKNVKVDPVQFITAIRVFMDNVGVYEFAFSMVDIASDYESDFPKIAQKMKVLENVDNKKYLKLIYWTEIFMKYCSNFTELWCFFEEHDQKMFINIVIDWCKKNMKKNIYEVLIGHEIEKISVSKENEKSEEICDRT